MPSEAELLEISDAESPEGGAALRPFWSGTISFGLVSIPVDLYPANRPNRVSLRTLSEDGVPLKRKYFSSKTDRELTSEDLVRGREMDDGSYVIVTDEELERLAPEKSRDIDLRLFVADEQIPPQYFEKAYFLVPGGGNNGSTKAYRLFGTVLQKMGRVGIGTFVMRGKEYLAAIFSKNGILCVETLRFHDELRTAEMIGLPDAGDVDADMTKEFAAVIKKESKAELAVKEMHDEVTAQLRETVSKKQAQQENVVTVEEEAEEAEPKVISILDVLRKSLAEAEAEEKQPRKSAAKRRAVAEESEKIPPRRVKKKAEPRRETAAARKAAAGG